MYSEPTKAVAQSYNIQERDVIFARCIAAGIDRGDAYQAIYNHSANLHKKSHDALMTMAAEHIQNNPAIKLLIARYKRQKPNTTTAAPEQDQETTNEAPNQAAQERTNKALQEVSTREGILKKLVNIQEGLQGKDELQALQFIAKLQGLDKEMAPTFKEMRTFFLPYRAKCRTCELMRAYISLKRG